MSYPNATIKSQQPGGAFTVATLPSASQMIGESVGSTAYTVDGGMQVWNGSTWQPVVQFTPPVPVNGFKKEVHLARLNSSATFNGTISTTVLSITAQSVSGLITVGQLISGAGVTQGTTITSEVQATFTGSIAANTGVLTITVGPTGTIVSGMSLRGIGIPPGTIITAGSGTTWNTNTTTAVASTAMVGYGMSYNLSASSTVASPVNMTAIMQNPKVAFIGDSTTSLGDQFSTLDTPFELYKSAFLETFPTKSFSFSDYTIGGTVISQAGSTGAVIAPGGGLPSWFTNNANTWISYVNTYNPTTLVVAFGINSTASSTPSNIAGFLALVAAFTNVPDIIFVTNTCANPAGGSPYNLSTYQAGALASAAATRTAALASNYWPSNGNTIFPYAGLPPIGLIDIGRYFSMGVQGFDPCKQILTQALPSSLITSGSGSTTTATLNFAPLATAPAVGSTITIYGVNPSTYNGTYTVLASPSPTTSSVSYTTSSPAGTYVSGGSIIPAVSLTSAAIASTYYYLPSSCDGDCVYTVVFNNGSSWSASSTVATIGFYDSTGSSPVGAETTGSFHAQTTNGTNVYANIYGVNSSFVTVVNGTGWSTTNNSFTVEIKNGHLKLTCNNIVLFNGIVPCASTSTFTPFINLSGTVPANQTITINSYYAGTRQQYTPFSSFNQVYGSLGGPNCGNGINHVSSYGLNEIYAPVIETVLKA